MKNAIVTLLWAVTVFLSHGLDAEQGGAGPVACSELASRAPDFTTIDSAELVAAGKFQEPPGYVSLFPVDYSNLPAFCRLTGSIRPVPGSDIGFEIWLPENGWNGNFLQSGNGGAGGSILYFTMVEPLARGYAVAHTDTGHSGGGGDFSWAEGNPEQMTDFQNRAAHELTRAGKAITTVRYDRAPEKSFFQGCSTGGRQALTEAQWFPADYDAIIAGAPAGNWTPFMALSTIIERSLTSGALPVTKLATLKEGAIAACDGDDGVLDRVISEPGRCKFDPRSLECGPEPSEGCLTPTEVAAARRIYAGIVTQDGEVLTPGTGPASEPAWAAYTAPGFGLGSSWFRHVVHGDPDWDIASFDPESDLKRAEPLDDDGLDTMNPDLSEFVANGGKLLIYHGTTDGLLPYGSTVEYYESVVEKLGADAPKDSIRFYLVPGMDHCAGGEGAFLIDWLGAMERWAEVGAPPGALAGTHPTSWFGQPPSEDARSFTRPVCPYPQIARYTGSGDTSDASSFECAEPGGQP